MQMQSFLNSQFSIQISLSLNKPLLKNLPPQNLTFATMLSQHPFGFSVSTNPQGITGTKCRGSRGARYHETPEVDTQNNIWSGNIKSISAMQYYKDKSHEELRLEDCELLKAIEFSFPSQSAFRQSSPLFDPLTSHVPSSVSALEVSKAPSFGITSTPLPWSSLSNAGRSNNPVSTTFGFSSRTTSAPGISSIFGIQNSSGFEGTTSTKYQKSRPGFSATAETSDTQLHVFGKLQSISAMPFYKDKSHEELRLEDYAAYVQPPFGRTSTGVGPFPLGGSTGDGFVDRGPKTCAFGTSSTNIFSASNNTTPLPWSSLSNTGSSNNPVSTTSGFSFVTTSASGSSSIFGIQNSSGFHGTTSTKYQRSRPGFSPTAEIASNKCSAGNIQSISAMPFYEGKSHEELKSEDYGLCNTCYKGGQMHRNAPFSRSSCLKTSDTPSNIFSFAPFSNPFSVPSPFQLSKSTLSELERDNSITPSNTISTAPTLSPPLDPLRSTNMFRSQPQAFTPATAPLMSSYTANLFKEPIVKGSCQCPNISTKVTTVSAPFSEPFTVHSPFKPSKSYFSELETENLMTRCCCNKISTAPPLSPFVSPFSSTSVYHSPQEQAFTLQPATASSGPTFASNLNQPSLIPFTDPMLKNSSGCPKASTTFTNSSVATFSFTEPSAIASSSIKFTPVISSDIWSSLVSESQPQQTSEKVGPLSTSDLNTPSQSPSGLTAVTQLTSQNINGLHNSSRQSSLVVNPFVTRFPTNQPNVETSRLHGISSLPVSNTPSPNRRASLLRLRHVSSRYPGLPTQKPNGRNSGTKVPFFIDKEDKVGSVAPFLARENSMDLVNISSLTLHSPRDSSKGDEVKESSSSSQGIERLSEDISPLLNQHEDKVDATADVVALLPKLPDGEEYYTEPSLVELAAKEMAEAGFCRHVEDFVVGRQGYGSIKFLGGTDIRHLDIESVMQMKNREVVVYPGGRKKPGVGQELNKAAEVTLLNVKCINKKTGKQYVEGHHVEGYKESLIRKAQEEGAEFVSYDPVKGEWKFRVQHF